MARRKQQDLLDRLIDSFSLRGFLLHQTTLFVAASAVVIAGVVFLWQNHADMIADEQAFVLNEDKIHINEPPPWADTDLKQLIATGADQQPSVLDPDLVSRAANRLQQVGFVERVREIKKTRSGLKIDLDYRQPVALVEFSPVTIPELKELPEAPDPLLVPVDRAGVLMPRELLLPEGLPAIWVGYPVNCRAGNPIDLSTWADIDDVRVRQGAGLAATIQVAGSLNVKAIVSFDPFESTEDPEFELWPEINTYGTIVQWGHAPGYEVEGEASPQQKLNALIEWVQQQGDLNQPVLRGRVPIGRRIDVRSGVAKIVPVNKTAQTGRKWFRR